jgi:tetratricopeptide (TPR) repeat protein
LTLPQAIKQARQAFAAGRYDEAERLCRAVTDVSADHFGALHLLGAIHAHRCKHTEALVYYDKAIAIRPDHAEAHFNRGISLHVLKRYRDAIKSYDRSLELKPDDPKTLNERGNTLSELGRYQEALASFDRILDMNPDHPGALSGRGNALTNLGRYDEALASHDRALQLRPNYPEAHNNRAITLMSLNRLEEAVASYDRAIEQRPNFAEALNNRGNALKNLQRTDEAMDSFARAIIIRPDYANAYCNRGVVHMEAKRLVQALADFETALVLQADNAQAHFNAANCRLLLGDFEHGWEENEWRWKIEQARNHKPHFAEPQWTGREEIAGKTMLLHAEQGLGDTIQFFRYVRLVKARGARVIVQVQPELKRFLSEQAGADIILARGERLPPFDMHCPLLSLPRAFGTRLATIPPINPQLAARRELAQIWDSRLGPKTKLRVGIAWSGRRTHKNDHNRSIDLLALLGFAKLPIQLVSLQKELRAGDEKTLGVKGSNIIHFGPSLTDFAETAALSSLMDLIISVDTSVAHLGASLGRPTWILLPFVPDWRWLLDRTDSPWYPNVRLFRQQAPGNWTDVIAQVISELSQFAAVARRPETPRRAPQITISRRLAQ